MTFFEPMASLAFLKSKTDFKAAIARPEKYPVAGLYPGSYSVKYLASSKVIEVVLLNLE